MKKNIKLFLFILFLVLSMFLLLSSCFANRKENSNQSTSQSFDPSTENVSLEYVPGSIKIYSEEEFEVAHDGFMFKPTYRYTYYVLEGKFSELVDDRSKVSSWLHKLDEGDDWDKEPKEMLLVTFVKHFNIQREDFEKARERMKQANLKWGFDMLTEDYELPNTDVIYTFDNELINEYYLRH